MLSCFEKKSPPKKKKCAAANPKVFKGPPSLKDLASAYVANEMLYEKQIQPRETGWYKSRWECVDRGCKPFGCHVMTTGQWINGRGVGRNFIWHCNLSLYDNHIENACNCTFVQRYRILSKLASDDFVGVRWNTWEYYGNYVDAHKLEKIYDAARNVIVRTKPNNPLHLKSQLFKVKVGLTGSIWTDGFKMPTYGHWTDSLKVPTECLTEAFFPIGEMPHNSCC